MVMFELIVNMEVIWVLFLIIIGILVCFTWFLTIDLFIKTKEGHVFFCVPILFTTIYFILLNEYFNIINITLVG